MPANKRSCTERRPEISLEVIGGRWPDLHPDLLAQILNRLEVDDFVRFLAVCRAWRSVPTKTKNCRPKPQIPWLLLENPASWCFVRLSPSCFDGGQEEHPEKKIISQCEINLPEIAHQRRIGCSQGFLITTDDFSKTLSAVNPLTGAHFPLPPTAAHPDIDEIIHSYDDMFRRSGNLPSKMEVCYKKAAISPSLDTIAVAIEINLVSDGFRFDRLVVARAGGTSWTCLLERIIWDIVFHKGHLHVLDYDGNLHIFDLDCSLEAQSYIPPTQSPGPYTKMFLVESPDGNSLFLLVDDFVGTSLVRKFEVMKLDESQLKWEEIDSMGEVALLFDESSLTSLSTREFPSLKRNCIYFTSCFVEGWNCFHFTSCFVEGWNCFHCPPVLCLEDGSIQPSCPVDGLAQLHCPYSSMWWFTPAL